MTVLTQKCGRIFHQPTNLKRHHHLVQSASNILTCPGKRSLATVFNDVIKWPKQQQSKSSRRKEYTPSVIPSDKWIEFHDLKAC